MMVHTSESHSDGNTRCSGCSWINIDIASIVLLFLAIVLYMLCGAAIFSEMERSSELEARAIWNGKLSDFAKEHHVTLEDLQMLLRDYEDANAAGIWVQFHRTQWDFSGAFCFAATIVSTIGYGMTAPVTINGKVFLIFFGLIGCSAAILFFSLFLERFITLITYVLHRCHEKKLKNEVGDATSHLTTQPDNAASSQEVWKASVYHVAVILLAISFLVAFGASGLYTAVEGWGYLESMYFCFVTFSTMGFGDMVSGLRERYEASWFYQITNSLAILLGVCCMHSLLNLISIMIKQMLNWVLGKMLCLNCHPETGLKHSCCSSFNLSKTEEPDPQQLQITACHLQQHYGCCVLKPSLPAQNTGKCNCAGSALETVCQSVAWPAEK